jgi:hypothetical protein
MCPPLGNAQIKDAEPPVMDGTPRYIVMAALAAVSLVLLAGLLNMLRGSNPSMSQTLMRWRVVLQFLAIAVMMLLVYLLRP